MRDVMIKVYMFKELSAKAQEAALINYKVYAPFPSHTEYEKSLNAFCDEFPVAIGHWEVDDSGDGVISNIFTTCASEVDKKTDYAINRYLRWKHGLIFSRPNNEKPCCPLTGFMADEALLAPLWASFERPYPSEYCELLRECVEAWFEAYKADIRDYYSDETIIREMGETETEFTEDGSVWLGN